MMLGRRRRCGYFLGGGGGRGRNGSLDRGKGGGRPKKWVCDCHPGQVTATWCGRRLIDRLSAWAVYGMCFYFYLFFSKWYDAHELTVDRYGYRMTRWIETKEFMGGNVGTLTSSRIGVNGVEREMLLLLQPYPPNPPKIQRTHTIIPHIFACEMY